MADNTILSRLDGLKLKYEETGQKLTDPEVIADVKQFVQLNKEYKELEPIIETSERYRTALANLAEAKDILANDKDEEMREMARGEITELEPAIEQMEEQIKLLLIPKDPQDSKNAIMEIRGGTGGDEAAIFAGDLLRMYTKYIESKGWRYEMTSFSDGAAGGYKEVVLKVTGQNVYGTLKYESDRDRYHEWNERANGSDVTNFLDVEKDIRPLADKLLSYGAKVILIKCGTPGIYFRTAAKEQLLKIGGGIGEEIAETWAVKEAFEKSYFVEKDKVASGTGAGDTTIAAFLSAILEGKSWEDALHLATATGALCVQTYDALSGIIPLDEVQKKIAAGWEKRK